MQTTGNETVKFEYGAAAQRVVMEKAAGSTPAYTKYYVHGTNAYPLVEKSADQDILHVYGPTGLLASKEVDGLWNFMLKDHLGSVRVVFNSSSTNRIGASLEDDQQSKEAADFNEGYPGGHHFFLGVQPYYRRRGQ